MTSKHITRLLLVILYAVAGILHLLLPSPFLKITPGWVPDAPLVITLTGLAEMAGAAALAQAWSPRWRRAAGWGLAAYALCVWPANIHHMVLDMARADHGLGLAYHIPRMLAQPLLIWAALWSSNALTKPIP